MDAGEAVGREVVVPGAVAHSRVYGGEGEIEGKILGQVVTVLDFFEEGDDVIDISRIVDIEMAVDEALEVFHDDLFDIGCRKGFIAEKFLNEILKDFGVPQRGFDGIKSSLAVDLVEECESCGCVGVLAFEGDSEEVVVFVHQGQASGEEAVVEVVDFFNNVLSGNWQ